MSDENLQEVWKLPKDAPLQISMTEEIRLAIQFAKERQRAAAFGFSRGVLAGLFATAAGLSLYSGGWSGWIAAVVSGVAAWWLWRSVSRCEEELLAILRKRLHEAKA